jgi:DNA repair photolyase
MNVIYAPKGRASEYGALAANLYRRCGHACVECYVPELLRMSYEDFNQPATLRPGVLEKLELEARQLGAAHDEREIVMSFTCDPYHPGDNLPTRRAIEIFMRHGLRFTVLTKGGTRSERDFDLMTKYRARCRYGATLTFRSRRMGLTFEPRAASPWERIGALSRAHDLGIPTWASIEPVLFPQESLEIMKLATPFVDEFRIGAVNHIEALLERLPGYVPPTRLEMVEFVHQIVDFFKDKKNLIIWKESMSPFLETAGLDAPGIVGRRI